MQALFEHGRARSFDWQVRAGAFIAMTSPAWQGVGDVR